MTIVNKQASLGATDYWQNKQASLRKNQLLPAILPNACLR